MKRLIAFTTVLTAGLIAATVAVACTTFEDSQTNGPVQADQSGAISGKGILGDFDASMGGAGGSSDGSAASGMGTYQGG